MLCQLLVHTLSSNVTHKVEQGISLFITTLIWGQMPFQHWLHLSTLVFIGWCTVYPFAILIFNIYPGNDVSIKTYLAYVGLGWQMYLCLITFECIWLCEKDSIFEEPRTRNATKMHRRQFCYKSIVFGGPSEILPMKSWLYFFQHTILHLDLLM